MQYIPTKFDQGSFVAKDVVFGTTHIDSPVSFTLVTNIAPQVSESIGTPPVVESVLFDSPVIQMVFEIDTEKAWLYRELQKAVLGLHGLVPIRCFELNQFLYPMDENYNIYAGVSAAIYDRLVETKDKVTGAYDIQKTNSRINLDNFLFKMKQDDEVDIHKFTDLFFDSYTPFFNVVNKETVQQSNGKITCVLYIQPVNMFSYFKDGIAYFIKDDIGIIKQEIINRYVNVHGFEQLESSARNMLDALNNIFNENSSSTKEESLNAPNIFTLSTIKNVEFPKDKVSPFTSQIPNQGAESLNFFTTEGAVTVTRKESKDMDFNLSDIQTEKTSLNKRIISYRELENKASVDGTKYFPKSQAIGKKCNIYFLGDYEEYANATSANFPRLIIDDGDTFSYKESEQHNEIPFRVQSLDTLETPKFHDSAERFGFAALSDGSRILKHAQQLGLIDINTPVVDDIVLADYFIYATIQGSILKKDVIDYMSTLGENDSMHIRYNPTNNSYGRLVGLCPVKALNNTSKCSISTSVTINRDYNMVFSDFFTDEEIKKAVKYLKYIFEKKYEDRVIDYSSIKDHLDDTQNIKSNLLTIFNKIKEVNNALNISDHSGDSDDTKILDSSVYVTNTGLYSIYEDGNEKVRLLKKAPLIIPFKYNFGNKAELYHGGFAFVNDVNDTVLFKKENVNYPRLINIKLSEDISETINAIHLPTMILSGINRDFIINNKAFAPKVSVESINLLKDSVSYNIKEIQDLISDLYNNHITIYPELSKPYRKFLNAQDEYYIKDDLKYRYTHVDSDLTYPLLYTSNMTLSKIKRNPSSDVALSYISKNIANVKFIDLIKSALYDVFFSGESQLKGLLDEYKPTARTNVSILSNENNYYLHRETEVGEFIDTIGSIFTDIALLSSDAVSVPGNRKIRLLTSLRTSVDQIKTALTQEYSTIFDGKILEIYEQASKPKLLNILGWKKDGKVLTSENFLADKNKLSYKDVSDRLVSHISVLLKDVVLKFVANVHDNGGAGISSEDYFMFAENINNAVKNIEDYYKKSTLYNSSDSILKFSDSANCSLTVIYESIANTSLFSDFEKFIKFIETEISGIVNVVPINFIKKRIVISDNVMTSITAISHSYSSMNTPISNSDSSIGTFFQCIQQPTEQVSILVTTSDYNLMRQLLLINYSQNMNNDQIVKTERLRTSGSSIQDNKKVSILMSKIEKLYDDITSPDPYSLDGMDLSMNLENDFLNSYGVKYIYINSIDITNVDNRAGVYNVQLNITKTIPKRIVNNYLKTTEKTPLLSSTMSSIVATHMSYNNVLKNVGDTDYAPDARSSNKNEYIENHVRIVGESAILSILPIGSVAHVLHAIMTRDRSVGNRRLDKLFKKLPVVSGSSHAKYDKLSFIELTYAFVDTMCSANISDLLAYLYDLKLIMEDYNADLEDASLDSVSDSLELSNFVDDTYEYLKKTIFNSIRTQDKDENIDNLIKTPIQFRDMIITSIEDIIRICSSNDLSYIRTIRATCQMLLFGYNNICFTMQTNDPKDYKDADRLSNVRAELKNHISFALMLLRMNGKCENKILASYLSQADNAFSELNNMIKISGEGKNKTAVLNKSLKFESKYIKIAFEQSGSNTNIKLKLMVTPHMIRAVSTMYDLLNKYGYLSFDYSDDFFIDNDLTDNPLTKVLIEFLQILNPTDYISGFLKETDGIMFDNLLSNAAKKFMFNKYITEGGKSYSKKSLAELKAYQHFMSKFSPIRDRYEYATDSSGKIKYTRKTKSGTFDMYSYLNSNETAGVFSKNIFDNNFSTTFVAYCDEIRNLVCLKTSDGAASIDSSIEDPMSENAIKKLIEYHNQLLIDSTTNKINSKFLTQGQNNDTISNKIDIDRIRPIENYLKASLLGSCYYICLNIGSEFFKNNSQSYSLGNSINNSFINTSVSELRKIDYLEYNQYDIIILVSAMMHFGTMGINNPYASSYFESSHSLGMPIVYAYDKKNIVTLMEKYTDAGIKAILTTILIGDKINHSPSFFITEDFQNTWAVAYLNDVLSDFSKVDTFENNTKKSADILIQEWADKHQSLIKETLKSVKLVKTMIRGILGNAVKQGTEILERKVDVIYNELLSINPFISEKPRAVDSKDAVENQKRIESAQKAVNELQQMIVQNFGRVVTSYDFQIIGEALNNLISNIERSSRSSKILEIINILGIENLNTLSGVSLYELEKGLVADGKVSELNRETFQVVKRMLTDILFNNSEVNKLTVNNTSKMLSLLKTSTKENNNIISLRSAFPIVKVLITKKGIPGMLVFDDYFVFSSINSINIFSNVDSPSSIAEIYFSDPFNDISQALDTPVFGTKIKESMTDLAVSSGDSYTQHTLAVGTGIQIRMGYSKNLDNSHTVFNGQIEHLSLVEGKIICGSSASSLLKPTYPTDMNIVVDSLETEYEADPTDASIAFDVTTRLLKLNPSAFDGIYNGITNNYDQTFGYFSKSLAELKKQYQDGTRSILSKGLNQLMYAQYRTHDMKPSDIRNLMYMSNVIQNNDEIFENFKPVRISTDVYRSMPNFVYIANTPTWECLQELQNHYPNHVLLARPYDNRETLIFKHQSGLYKTSSSYCHELINIEKVANNFKTLGANNSTVYKNIYKKLNKYVEEIKNRKTSEKKKVVLGNINNEYIYSEISSYNPSNEQIATYCICKLIYDICAIPLDSSSQASLDRSSLLDNFVNQDFSDIKEYMLKESNSDEINNVLTQAMEILNKVTTNLKSANSLVIHESTYAKDMGNLLITAGRFAFAVNQPLGLALGGFGLISRATAFSKESSVVDNSMSEYNMVLAINTIYESLLSLSKNYRNISVTHVIDSSNIIANDIQLLRNGNAIKMSAFNKESPIGTYSQILTNTAWAGLATGWQDGSHIERINYATNEAPVLHNANFSKRKISNLDNPGNWITYNYVLDKNIPDDKLFSIYTSQPNADFLESAMVKENTIVGSSLLRKMLQEYYGGTITIFGNGNIFVGDKLYIDDKRSGITGVVEVREVLHSFSPTFGYTTTITPSMIVSSSEKINQITTTESVATLVTDVVNAFAIGYAGSFVGTWLKSFGVGNMVKGFVPNFAGKTFAGGSVQALKGLFVTLPAFTTAMGLLHFTTQTFGRMGNYFTGTLSIVVDGNQQINQSILCLNKNGVPFVSNMEGLNFAHILNENGKDASNPYHRYMQNMSNVSSEDYFEI